MADCCPSCDRPVLPHLERCTFCSCALELPNVRAATLSSEREALEQRYQEALANASALRRDAVVREFERQVSTARAVMCKNVLQFCGIVGSKGWLIATYYDQVDGGSRLPDDPQWDWERAQERRWFPNYTDQIRYAALSLNDRGASGWGKVVLVFDDAAIQRRATVGESNAVWFARRIDPDTPLPPGFRATWSERAKLCVAKLSEKLAPDTTPDQFPGILLRDTGNRDDDEFVEVHIYGTLSLEGVARVRIPKEYEQDQIMREACEKLRARNVVVEFV